MKELGPGFLERIYKNALLITMKEKGLRVETEKPFEVVFRNKVIGRRKLEYQRLHQSTEIDSETGPVEEPLPF